jgi:RHS repeat-associated protein
LASITNGASTISYTYDANGNITAITQGSTVIAYGYDDLGQVVRENNARDNKTIIYDYDLAGNILSRTTYTYTTGSVDGLTPISTLTYSYGNSVWKDQLTAFNGTAITYDALGNPLSYSGMTFTWEKGRQLSGLSATDLSASYTYNDAGIRTSKTVNNVTTTYQLSGDKVTAEITGNQIIYYTFDASGQVVTMSVNGAEYYYVRNGQNDVIALVDSTGTIVVEYTYSTYGEVLSITGYLASTIGVLNPYRYRGYRYDNESGLYYLQSRYYNPVWGRFINADEEVQYTEHPTGMNLFAYSFNNHVNLVDFNGEWPNWINQAIFSVTSVALCVAAPFIITPSAALTGGVLAFSTLTGAAIGLVANVGKQMLIDKKSITELNIGELVTSTAAGAASGALATVSGGGIAMQMIGNAVISGANTMVNGGSVEDIATSAAIGAVGGLVGGKGGVEGFFAKVPGPIMGRQASLMTEFFLKSIARSGLVSNSLAISQSIMDNILSK